MISRDAGGGPYGPVGEPLPPPRSPLSAATWRECAYLLSSWLVGVVAFAYVLAWFAGGVLLSVTLVGLPVLACGLLGCRLIGRVERARARALLAVEVDEPSPARALRRSGLLGSLWSLLKDPVGWRSALFVVVRLPWALVTLAIMLPAFVVAWPALPWLARWLSQVDRALVRVLLSPSDELERRIAELEEDRSVVVDTSAADLRRIERDL
ncbi:sensor domain-containing protein, partial [Streptomyces sedi]